MPASGFFSAIEQTSRIALLKRGARKVYAKGETIFAYGEPGDSMLVIETGRVDVAAITEEGRRLHLGQLGAGDLAGEMALFARATRSADVVAATPVTGVLLTYAVVEGFLLEHPRAMLQVLLDLSAKLRAANALAETRALGDGAARLARCLLGLAERWGEEGEDGSVRLRERFSQGDLGEMSGLARENVNRRLRAWTRAGLVAQEDGRLILLRPDDLERAAHPPDRTDAA